MLDPTSQANVFALRQIDGCHIRFLPSYQQRAIRMDKVLNAQKLARKLNKF